MDLKVCLPYIWRNRPRQVSHQDTMKVLRKLDENAGKVIKIIFDNDQEAKNMADRLNHLNQESSFYPILKARRKNILYVAWVENFK